MLSWANKVAGMANIRAANDNKRLLRIGNPFHA
jgi:hypothetical protein